jgi:S1-C subfamily serine protease
MLFEFGAASSMLASGVESRASLGWGSTRGPIWSQSERGKPPETRRDKLVGTPRIQRLITVTCLLLAMVLPSGVAAAPLTTVVKLWVGNNVMMIGAIRQPIDSEGTKPVIVEGRTLVPIRAVIEAFDGSVAWDATARKVTVTLGENALNLWIGKSTATLNGTTLPVDAANPRVIPVIMSGRTMLPLRFVSESLGIDVQYEAATKMITLTYTVNTTPPVPPVPLLVSPADGSKLTNELPKLSWLPATGTDASRVQILSSGVEVHVKSNLTGAEYVVPSGVLADGTYTWRVSAHNEGGWGAWSPARSFVLASIALPPAPSLLTPANQSTVSAGPVTLTWTAVTDASVYRVRVLHGTDQTHSGTDIIGTSYTVLSGVLVAGSYSWQVGAYAGSTWSDWSAAWGFTVQASAPSAPRLLTPADQSILDSTGIVLTWASVADADSYRIQVLRDGTEVHAASGLSSTTYSVPSGVLVSGRYSWQAAAHGPGGWSAWSDAFLFEARAKLTTSDIAKYVDRMVLIEVNGFEDGEAFSASGSGFFISSDGKIVTNYHVINAATQGTVTLNGGQKYDISSVLGYNKDQDLAVIRISGTGLPICVLGDSSKVAVGDPVVAIGSPLGIQNTVSEGIVSKLWEDGSLQITAPISPGSSGGALFNMYGEVIGVTTWKIRNGENMNVAVPANLVRSLDTTLNLTLAQVFQKEYPGAAVLPAPVLVGPVTNSILSTLTPTLSWTTVPGATKYSVSIWVAPNVKPNLVDAIVTSTSYTVPTGLLSSGGRYGWTVCAGNSLGWSEWATVSGSTYSPAFTVQVAIPINLITPTPSSPADATDFWSFMGNIAFAWSPVAGADYYEFWIGTGMSGAEATAVYKKAVYGSSWTLPQATLARGQVYTWAVQAVRLSGGIIASDWSVDWHFSIVAHEQAILLSPSNLSTVSYSPTLYWTPVSGATHYYVYVFDGEPITANRLLMEQATGTSYSIPGLTLTRGRMYTWWVGAFAAQYVNGEYEVMAIANSVNNVFYTTP